MHELIGKSFHNMRGTKCHVINVFTDCDEEIIVYKMWIAHKQFWHVEAEYLDIFMIQFNLKDSPVKWDD